MQGVQCPASKCPGLLVGEWDESASKAKWSCLECHRTFAGDKNPHSHEHHVVTPPDPEPINENHGCHCCHDHGHGHHQDDPKERHCEEEVVDASLSDALAQAKGDKDGGGFDPGSVAALAQESLGRAMEAYSQRQLPRAIRLLEHHVKTFEGERAFPAPACRKIRGVCSGSESLSRLRVRRTDASAQLLPQRRQHKRRPPHLPEDPPSSAAPPLRRSTAVHGVQSFDRVLKTSSSLEQSNFQKVLGELYRQKMQNCQSTTQSAVVGKLMKKHVSRPASPPAIPCNVSRSLRCRPRRRFASAMPCG